jgi:hypothetical protein
VSKPVGFIRLRNRVAKGFPLPSGLVPLAQLNRLNTLMPAVTAFYRVTIPPNPIRSRVALDALSSLDSQSPFDTNRIVRTLW